MTNRLPNSLPDEPALIVTTGRGECFTFSDFGPAPEVTGLGAAVLVTRLRWWADRIERDALAADMGMKPAKMSEVR